MHTKCVHSSTWYVLFIFFKGTQTFAYSFCIQYAKWDPTIQSTPTYNQPIPYHYKDPTF